ncbi:hypothetical protein HKX48_006624 [Thoreauomyces humboldtii]|nr:hypothetical protein HKX48_006624 [Thoreauomyces humboldtii]
MRVVVLKALLAALTTITFVRAAVSDGVNPPLPWTQCTDKTSSIQVSSVQATYDPVSRKLDVYGHATTTVLLGGASALADGEHPNGTVHTNLEVVGFDYWDVTSDLCDAVVCPVQPGPFTFYKNLTLPLNIPFIDWKPQVTFYDGNQDSPNELGCVKMDLDLVSSGINYGVTWGTFVVALYAAFTTLLTRHIRVGYTPTLYDMSSGWSPTARLLPSRVGPGFMDAAFFVQFVAATGQLEWSYPVFYQDFVRMFTWATGTWNVPFVRSIARGLRGGGLTVLAQQEAENQANTGVHAIKLISRDAVGGAAWAGVPPDQAISGYDRYAAMLGMNANEMFLNTLVPFVLVLIVVALWCLGIAMIRSYYRHQSNTDSDIFANPDDQTHHIRHYFGGWCLRVLYLFYFGLTSTSLRQLTFSNEPPAVMTLAGIVFILLGLGVPIFTTLRLITIARMNRGLEHADPELADEVYARSIRGNIQNFRERKESEPTPVAQYARSIHRDEAVTREAETVYARMRSVSQSGSSIHTRSSHAPLRAFSVSSKRSNATTATSGSRSSAWPLPPLYLSQKFMLLYGPLFNAFAPSHFVNHAEFLTGLTWWVRIAPAFAIGVLGKLAPPYVQFVIMFSGDATLFAYMLWKRPFSGKATNWWQWFINFCRCGIFLFLFAAFLFRKDFGIEWIAQLLSVSLILAILGVLGIFMTSSGLKFLAAFLKGFKRRPPPVLLSSDPVDRIVQKNHTKGSRSRSVRRGESTHSVGSVAFPDGEYEDEDEREVKKMARKRLDSRASRITYVTDDDDDEEEGGEQEEAIEMKKVSAPRVPPSAITRNPTSTPTVLPPAIPSASGQFSEEDYFARARALTASGPSSPVSPTTITTTAEKTVPIPVTVRAVPPVRPVAKAPARKNTTTTTTSTNGGSGSPSGLEQREMHEVVEHEQGNPYFDV